MRLLVCHIRAANGSWSCAYDLVLCLKIWPPVLDFVRGAYMVDFTDLANDITNQSREFLPWWLQHTAHKRANN